MANEIGWGAAFSEENGYGMAAVTGAEIGYGNVVITSYSGETNISSMDADNPREDEMDILSEPLNITVIEGSIYMYFLLRVMLGHCRLDIQYIRMVMNLSLIALLLMDYN